ncbi:MAG: hypothetical protein E7214_09385 [Clostridium sp.]|nr:hypothetical protein [Clostridium sp.]
MKKGLIIGIISISIIFLIFLCTNYYKERQVQIMNEQEKQEDIEDQSNTGDQPNTEENIDIKMNPVSISITKYGQPICKKDVQGEDINKIMTFLNSIKLEKKLDEGYKGWAYIITLKDSNGEIEELSVFKDEIEYGKYFFNIDPSVVEELDKIYNELNYPEVNPLT